MRSDVLIVALFLSLGLSICGSVKRTNLASVSSPLAGSLTTTWIKHIDFATEIKPILEARCQPCHFQGGKMYDKLPFDKPETIKTLGTKLFTRLKNENEQSSIRAFLAQP